MDRPSRPSGARARSHPCLSRAQPAACTLAGALARQRASRVDSVGLLDPRSRSGDPLKINTPPLRGCGDFILAKTPQKCLSYSHHVHVTVMVPQVRGLISYYQSQESLSYRPSPRRLPYDDSRETLDALSRGPRLGTFQISPQRLVSWPPSNAQPNPLDLLIWIFSFGYNQKRLAPRCALKVDLRKVYDIVEWGILLATMKLFGFFDQFILWIEECVTTTSYSVCLNGNIMSSLPGHVGYDWENRCLPIYLLSSWRATKCLLHFLGCILTPIKVSSLSQSRHLEPLLIKIDKCLKRWEGELFVRSRSVCDASFGRAIRVGDPRHNLRSLIHSASQLFGDGFGSLGYTIIGSLAFFRRQRGGEAAM
ncbi:hypothetical protein Sango_2088500 [Sesamum angolense]|uniref:Reverse transcriptase domain-containing protein n=1 Tax=Sesamum angolense TaxID=2727404 RepID=A0AAE1WBJ2_9LAMI|nr:hypothetical protein Sango_2088500 [Sesamum angolense]